MEYDDLDEPEDQVESQVYLSRAHFETQVNRAQSFHENAFHITSSLPENRLQRMRQECYYSLGNVGNGIKREDVTEAEMRWPQNESISLLHDMPVRMPIKMENDISLPAEENLRNQPEPYSEQRYRVRLRDDLDEPVALPPPQRTRLDLVDDLDEPEDLSQASETDFHDDLHEPADVRPPVALAHNAHDAHDDLDDLDEPAVNASPEVSRGNNVLLDDLEDPVAPTHQSHREGMKYREELHDDLGDPDVDEETDQTTSTSDGRLDNLYDDLDEVLVDELISEVSDLVLQSYESAHIREEPMEEGYAPDPRTPISKRSNHQSSADYRNVIRNSTGTRPHVTSMTQQDHIGLLDREKHGRNVGGTPSGTQQVARRSVQNSQQVTTQLTSQEAGQGDKTPRTAICSSASQHQMSASSVTASALQPLVPSQREVNETGDGPSPMRTSHSHSSSQIQTALVGSNNADVRTNIDGVGGVREEMHQHSSTSSEGTDFSSDVSPKDDATQPSGPQQSLTHPLPEERSSPSSYQSQEARIAARSLLPPSPVPFRHGPLSDALSCAPEDTNLLRHPMEISSPEAAVMTLSLESSSSDAPAINEDTPQLNPTKKVRNLPSTLVVSASTAEPPTARTRQRPARGGGSRRAPVQTETVLARIDALLAAVATCRQRGETPELVLPAKTKWRDLQFCTSAGHLVLSDETPRPEVRVRGECRLNMMVLLLQKIRHLVSTNTHSTKRDIYYQEASLFGSQRTVDALLDDVTSLLAIPRESSHVRATSKGLVAGDLVLRCGDVIMDCSAAKHGLLVPENVPHVQLVSSTARFILVVEKDATFQKILDSGVLSQMPPGIVMTGKGFPDLNTRLLLKMLTTRLPVPALALVDADPHGLEIFFVYKYGSLARARESDRLATPGLIWLGVRPTEVLQLDIPRSALLPLTAADRSKAQCLLSRPYVKHNRLWQRQIREILASGRKAEIQCLSAIHPTFLTDLYLPSKIQECIAEHERQAACVAEQERHAAGMEGGALSSGPSQQQQQQVVAPAVSEGGDGPSGGRGGGAEGRSQHRDETHAEARVNDG